MAAILLANGAAAYPVAVNNHSFELPATADGVINNASGVTAWNYSGTGSPGIFNPSASQSHYTGMGNADPNGGVLPNMVGPGMGFMFPGNGNTGEFSQTLEAALQANTTYTLTVAIGHRNYFNNAQVPKDFRIALVTATTQTVVAEFIADVRCQNPLNLSENTTGTITLTQSTFTDFSASTTTGTSPAGLGEPLVIRIQSLANGRYLDIDNVRLDASPASAGSAPVLIDWSTAAAVANPAGDGKRWNSLGTPNINNVPQPLTPTQLINSTGAASGISVAVSFGTTTNSSGSGFGGTAIAGPTGPDPFDETNAVNDGIFVNSNTAGGDSTATITFTGLANSTQYDISAIGGRASNGVNGLITIVTGTSANPTYDLLNNGTLSNFSVTSNASGVIVLNFREIDPNNNSANAVFKALSITRVTGPAATIDVYLLGGQSNMQGTAKTADLPSELLSIPEILLYAAGSGVSGSIANQWVTLRPSNGSTFGPEIAIGAKMRELCPGQPIALIKYAASGNSLEIDFKPGANASDTANWSGSFTAMVNTYNSGLAKLAADGWQPVIKGMCWQQGEQDAKDGLNVAESNTSADDYGSNLSHFVHRIRQQFASHASPDGIRFVPGQVLPYAPPGGDVVTRFPGRDLVRQAILNADENSGAPLSISNTRSIPTNHTDHPVHEQDIPGNTDEVHLGATAQLNLGRSMAYAMMDLDPLSYANWATSKSVIGTSDDDDDGDGLTNRFEYETGGDPRSAAAAPRPILDLVGGSHAEFLIKRNLEASEGGLMVQFSKNLSDWTSQSPELLSSTRETDGTATLRYRAPVPVADPGQPRGFFRVSHPSP